MLVNLPRIQHHWRSIMLPSALRWMNIVQRRGLHLWDLVHVQGRHLLIIQLKLLIIDHRSASIPHKVSQRHALTQQVLHHDITPNFLTELYADCSLLFFVDKAVRSTIVSSIFRSLEGDLKSEHLARLHFVDQVHFT